MELMNFANKKIDIKDNKGNTPVSIASKAERNDIVGALRKAQHVENQNPIQESLL